MIINCSKIALVIILIQKVHCELSFTLKITSSPHSLYVDPSPILPNEVEIDDEFHVEGIKYRELNGEHFLVPENGHNITGLEACTNYEVWAEIINATSHELFQNVSQFETTLYEEPVTEITEAQTAPFSILLTWASRNKNCVKEHSVWVNLVSQKENITIHDWTGPERAFEISDLSPCLKHEIVLKTFDVKDQPMKDNKKLAKTSTATPGEVRNIEILSVNSTSAQVRWDEPAMNATCVKQYNIKYADCFKETPCNWLYLTVHPDIREATLKGLKSCTKYGLTVFANGEASENIHQFRTWEDFAEPVRNVNGKSDTPTEAHISWDAPEKNGKCVKFYEVSSDGALKIAKNITFVIFYELEPCREYHFSIVAVYEDAVRSPAATINVTIIEDQISDVNDLKLLEDHTGDITVSWKAPTHAAYCIKSYRIVAWYWDPVQKQDIEVSNTLTNDTFTAIKDIFACVLYSVQIIPISSSNNEGLNLIGSVYSKERVIYKHHIVNPLECITTKYSLTLNSSLTKENKNYCKLLQAEFICRLDRDAEQSQSRTIAIDNTVTEYIATVEPLIPYSKYGCSVRIRNQAGWSEETAKISFTTEEDFPGPPEHVEAIQGTNCVNITWQQPDDTNGILINYRIYIIAIGPKYLRPSNCGNFQEYNKTISVAADSKDDLIVDKNYGYSIPDLMSYVEYVVQVAAVNKAGIGSYSEPISVVTLPSRPEPVTFFSVEHVEPPKLDENYSSHVILQWLLPCHLNGKLKGFIGTFYGERTGYESHFYDWKYQVHQEDYEEQFNYNETNLRPEHTYTVTINVLVDGVNAVSETVTIMFDAPAGIPQVDETIEWGVVDPYASPNPTKSAEIILSKKIFDSYTGSVKYLALMVSERHCQDDPIPKSGLIDEMNNWPEVVSWDEAYTEKCVPQYQTTPKLWNPLLQGNANDDEISYIIGTDYCLTKQDFCNGFLKPGTEYAVVVRLFSSSGYSDSVGMTFKTDFLVAIYGIVLSVFGCLLIAFMLGMFILWRTNKILQPKKLPSLTDEPIDIAVKNFPTFYDDSTLNENEKIMKEYKIVNSLTDDLVNASMTTNAARANEAKNRYTNILPYDLNRVVLDVEEHDRDDETLGDYINASYINGYKYQREYIATQGPKPGTCFDFWRMILQCNVEVVVMLTQLVESNKIKCHEYYPKFNKEMYLDDIYIKCTQELNFTIYKKRLFTVERKLEKKTVVHYHYNKWPDHGCPENPIELIKFIKIMRSERKMPSASIVVHCSAGVGRTGTLIALDILQQRIQQEKKINIYDTVKQLRLQRVKMVQTSQQYIFLYDCCLEIIKGKSKRLSQSKSKDDDSSISSQPSRWLNIRFPKNFNAGLSDVKSFVPNQIESAM